MAQGERNCTHEQVIWNLAECNEDGWNCAQCDTSLGFRPDLDRSDTYEKCRSILFWLDHYKFIRISNGTEGEIITEDAVTFCKRSDTYDQQSIIRFILNDPNLSGTHAKFWRKEAKMWPKSQLDDLKRESNTEPF